MGLQLKVRELRDQNIKLAVDNGIPSKKVAQLHGISPARVAQIAPRKR